MKNVFFQTHINAIGGTETFLYNVVRCFPNKDITVMYTEGTSEQLYRLSKYCKLVKFDGHPFTCERLFVNYGWDVIKDYAHVTVQGYNIVHANYKYLNENYNDTTAVPDNGFETLAVSDFAGKNCGTDYKVVYNPIFIEEVREPYLIVSATRLHKDKGDIAKRMLILANRLTERNIPFIWLVFTNDTHEMPNKNIVKVNPRLDILPYIKKADFVAQLSDSEACCYTVLEALTQGVPVLCTKIPSFYEEGLNEDNTIFFDFDMSNVDKCIDKMKNKFDFKFIPPSNCWDELLVGERTEKIIPMKKYKVKATDAFQVSGGLVCDELGYVPAVGEVFEILDDKLDFYCKGKNKREVIYAELIEEVEEPKEEKLVIEPKRKRK